MFWIATEDELSERVGCKLLHEEKMDLEIRPLRRNGYGYLKSSLKTFAKLAHRFPVLILTDLDRADCAPNLRNRWMGNQFAEAEFLFRVVVREVEAWLLADREAIGEFFKLSPSKIVRDTETIGDPKRYLLSLAQKAPAAIRADLVQRRRSELTQGFGYNVCMGAFVDDHWSPQRAAENNASLKKAMDRLKAYAMARADGTPSSNNRLG